MPAAWPAAASPARICDHRSWASQRRCPSWGRGGEAVQLLQGDPGAVEASEHDPAALGAEVHGGHVAGGHRLDSTGTRWTGTPAAFQATTSSSGVPSSVMRPVIPAVSTNGCRANRPTLLLSNSP